MAVAGFVVAAIIVVWGVLLGAAYCARTVMGLRRTASLLLLAGCYVVLAAIALVVVGSGGRGPIAAAGMLVPLTVACALAVMPRP